MSKGGPFKKGHDPRRQKRKPLMAAQREAIRLVKEGTPKAARALLRLLDSDDEKIVYQAAKVLYEKGIPQEVVENLFSLPDDLLDRTPTEQYAFVQEQLSKLLEVNALMKAEAEAFEAGAGGFGSSN
jgi:hypothetical protein